MDRAIAAILQPIALFREGQAVMGRIVLWSASVSVVTGLMFWPPHKILNLITTANNGPPQQVLVDQGEFASQLAAGADARAVVPAAKRRAILRVAKADDARQRALRLLAQQTAALDAELSKAKQDVARLRQRFVARQRRAAGRKSKRQTSRQSAAMAPMPKTQVQPSRAASWQQAGRKIALGDQAPRQANQRQDPTSKRHALGPVQPARPHKVPSQVTAARQQAADPTVRNKPVLAPKRELPPAREVASKADTATAVAKATVKTRTPAQPIKPRPLPSEATDKTRLSAPVTTDQAKSKTQRPMLDATAAPLQTKQSKITTKTNRPDRAAAAAEGRRKLARRDLGRLKTAPADSTMARKQLVLALQKKLFEINCKPGPIDGRWGRQALAALERAYNRQGILLDSAVANEAALKIVQAMHGKVCLDGCKLGQVMRRGICIASPRRVKLRAAAVREAKLPVKSKRIRRARIKRLKVKRKLTQTPSLFEKWPWADEVFEAGG